MRPWFDGRGGTIEGGTSGPSLWIRSRVVQVEGYDLALTGHAQMLLREALALSEEERAGLVAELLVSLEGPAADDEPVVERAWAVVVERRARRVLASEAVGEDWSLVRDRVRRALTDG